MSPDEFFGDHALSKTLYEAVHHELEAIGEMSMRVSKSQIAFRRRRGFAWVWMPGQYRGGRGAPLVLTVSLPYRDASPRWKEIVEPAPERYIHHLELDDPAQIDDEVREWLRLAWDLAG